VSIYCLPADRGGTSQLMFSFNSLASIRIIRDDGSIQIYCNAKQICSVSDTDSHIQELKQNRLSDKTTLSISVKSVAGHISTFANKWTVTVVGSSKSWTGKCRIYGR
ncbi:hypothetical protein BgiBS90_019422, partial [Biomphalaria glabrata]